MGEEMERLQAELTDTQLILGQKEMTVQRLVMQLNAARMEIAALNERLAQLNGHTPEHVEEPS